MTSIFNAALEIEYGAAVGILKFRVKSKSAIPVLMEITFLIGDLRRSGRNAVTVLKIPTRFIWMDLLKSSRTAGRLVSLFWLSVH